MHPYEPAQSLGILEMTPIGFSLPLCQIYHRAVSNYSLRNTIKSISSFWNFVNGLRTFAYI